MQFRLMGKKIQCIRSVYNKETKKCDMKIICTIPQSVNEITPDVESLIVKLTPQERSDLVIFLHNRFQKAKNQQIIEFYKKAPEELKDLSQFIQKDSEHITEEWINNMWRATHELQKVFKKMGYPKPTKKRIQNTKIEHQKEQSHTDVFTKHSTAKSLFREFHDDIVSLINQGNSVSKIVEELKIKYPTQGDNMTYNGLRSYIRRNIKP